MKEKIFLAALMLLSMNVDAVARYDISFDKNTTYSRNDRRLNSVSLRRADGTTSVCDGLATHPYNDCTLTAVFTAKAGETVQPLFGYTGNWMAPSVYVDWNKNGAFETTINPDGTPAEGSDVVSYNGIMVMSGSETYYKSDGNTVASGNQIGSGTPAFTIPANTPAGYYVMRYKVDWNSIDSAGNKASGNTIMGNGGAICDVLLNVYPEDCEASYTVVGGTADKTSEQIKAGEAPTIHLTLDANTVVTEAIIRYGYDLSSPRDAEGNVQYFEKRVPLADAGITDSFTIPAECTFAAKMEVTIHCTTFELVNIEQATTLDKEMITVAGQMPKGYERGYSLYIDINQDGAYNSVTEVYTAARSLQLEPGNYQVAAVAENGAITIIPIILVGETGRLSIQGNNVRIIGRSYYKGATKVESKGMPDRIPALRPLLVEVQPYYQNYEGNGWATIRRGINLDGPAKSDGRTNWTEFQARINVSGKVISIPADSVYNDIRIIVDYQPNAEAQNRLKWADEFNGTEIDTGTWVTSPRLTSTWNRFCSSDPRVNFVEDGSLVCRAMRDTNDPKGYISGAQQTSGNPEKSILHGYVEVRCKNLPHSGDFPAIWLMPYDRDNGGWPHCGEIDIWETIDAGHISYHTVHTRWHNSLGKGGISKSASERATQDEWHCYGLKKEDGRLTWYLDGQQVFTYWRLEPQTQEHIDGLQWPYEKDWYVILNQSIGDGSWAAGPDPNFVYETRFDYCRVYEDGAPQTTAITPPFAPAVENNTIFDLSGRRYNGTWPSGIIIRNGKKILNK